MTLREFLQASGFFLFITLVFFYKIFLGQIPLPSDLTLGGYYPWLSYKWDYAVSVPVKNIELSDVVSLIYPLKTLAVDDVKKGELPLWDPLIFGGYPLFASVQLG